MADLAELQEAILRNQQAAGRLAGLDEQYERANALRDEAAPEINRYGTVSPLSIIANTINKSRGRRDARLLDPQREQARADIAAGEAQMEGETLRRALAAEQRDIDKIAYDKTRDQIEDEQTEFMNGLRTDKAALEAKKAGYGSGDSYTFTDGESKMPVTTTADGTFIQSTGPNRGQPVPEGWYEDLSSSRGYSGGKHMTPNQLRLFTNSGNQVRKVSRAVGNYRDDFAQLNGLPTGIANKIISGAGKQDLLSTAGFNELDRATQDSIAWWADWKMTYELLKRHELFGATLTNNEMGSWEEAVGAMRGMSPDRVRARITQLFQDLQDDLANEANAQMDLSANRPNEIKALSRVLRDAGAIQQDDGSWGWEREGGGQREIDANTLEESRNWVPPPGLVSTFDGLTTQEQNDIRSIPDPNLRAQALQEIKNTPATTSVLPQATQQTPTSGFGGYTSDRTY